MRLLNYSSGNIKSLFHSLLQLLWYRPTQKTTKLSLILHEIWCYYTQAACYDTPFHLKRSNMLLYSDVPNWYSRSSQLVRQYKPLHTLCWSRIPEEFSPSSWSWNEFSEILEKGTSMKELQGIWALSYKKLTLFLVNGDSFGMLKPDTRVFIGGRKNEQCGLGSVIIFFQIIFLN